MKPHLPTLLRAALLLSLFLPAQAALTWNSGNWNTTDASWLENAAPAVFSNGDDVEFTPAATSTSVLITETVEPGSVLISGSGFVFSGAGSIGGTGGLTLLSGASLVVENANAFTGGTVVNAGASVTISLVTTEIAEMAFYNCAYLSHVYYTGTPEQWERISIGGKNYSLIAAAKTFG